MQFDGHSAVADKQHTGRCQTPPQQAQRIEKYTDFFRQNRNTGSPFDLGTRTQDETLRDKHVFIVLSFITDSSTEIKDPPSVKRA